MLQHLRLTLACIGGVWLLLHVTLGWTFNGAPLLAIFVAFLIWARGLFPTTQIIWTDPETPYIYDPDTGEQS